MCEGVTETSHRKLPTPGSTRGESMPSTRHLLCDSPLKRDRQDVQVPTDCGAVPEVLDVGGIYGKGVFKLSNPYPVTNCEEKGGVTPTHVC